MANQFYNENAKAIDNSSKHASDKYAAGYSTVGGENDNRDTINQNRRDYDNSEGMIAAIVDDRIEGTISSMNQAADWAHSEKFANGYRTDLGAFMNFKTNIAVKDLGQLMTDRMQKSMSKENINKYGYVGLAYTSSSNGSKNYTTDVDPSDLYVTKDFPSDAYANDINDEDTSKLNGGNKRQLRIDEIATKNSFKHGLRLGEAKVLNPDFQFNELDDVRSDIREYNLGRLYAERIYDFNLPILYLNPGTVKINTALISDLNSFSKNQEIGNYLKNGSAIPAKVFNVAFNIINGFKTGVDWILSKGMWYDFKFNFRQYSNYVNDMLIELAMWMGLFGDSTFTKITADKIDNLAESFMSSSKVSDFFNKFDNNDGGGDDYSENMMEDGTSFFNGYVGGCKDGKLNIHYILPNLYSRISEDSSKSPSTISGEDNKSWNLDLARLTIPFALNKSIGVSESFNNTVDNHPVMTELNGMYETSNEAKLKGQWGMLQNASDIASSKNIIGTLTSGDKNAIASMLGSSAFEFVKSSFGNIGTVFGASGALVNAEAGMIIKGEGRFSLPKVWSDSSYSRNYSINMKFRSPYGNRIAIFENTFIPLIFLIGLTSPRQSGFSSYTSPYYVKAYSKGLISCELGMITSLSINRGEDRNDRTVEGFFRTISVNLTIEDVLPTMSMSMSAGMFAPLKSANTGLKNYLTGLANIDFIERESFAHRLNVAVEKLPAIVTGLKTNIRSAFLNNFEGGKRLSYIATGLGLVKNEHDSANMFHSSY